MIPTRSYRHYYEKVPPSSEIGISNDEILSNRKFFSWKGIVVFLFLSIIFIISYLRPLSYQSDATAFNSREIIDERDIRVYKTILNPDYPEGLKSTKDNMLPWPYVIEPFKTHVATLDSLTIDSEEISLDSYDIEWYIGGSHFIGKTGTFSVDVLGNTSATITFSTKPVSNEPVETFTHNFYVVVKYIRREIRNMTDYDRNTFLDALQVLYTVNDSVGQAKYGEKFHSMEYYLVLHLIGAGTTDCDHWHDGAGIVTHHMAFTLSVEQALQSINPAISMPYWEYGKDALLYSLWTDSPVFNDDWFGEANPLNSDHTISRGRWNNTAVPDGSEYKHWDISNTGTLNPFINAYGQLRSPWNNNPTSKLGRHNLTYDSSDSDDNPSCSIFYSCFEYDTLAELNYCLNGMLHGTVHIKIGGAWEKNITSYDSSIYYVSGSYRLLLFKKLWRKGYTRCPDYCPNDGVTLCRCSVPKSYIKKFGIKAMLEDVDADAEYSTAELYERAIPYYEDPGIAGDMFTSAAPYDPTFWPLHGSMERLLDLKRILFAQGNTSTTLNETWGFYEDGSVGALEGACDWSQVNGPNDLTLPTCNSDVTCHGHGDHDVLEFGNFLNKGETYRNVDFYEFMHPWNLDLPYTYDTFDYDYCSSDGYSFVW